MHEGIYYEIEVRRIYNDKLKKKERVFWLVKKWWQIIHGRSPIFHATIKGRYHSIKIAKAKKKEWENGNPS